MPVAFRGVLLLSALLLLLGASGSVAQNRSKQPQTLVQADFNERLDSQGFRWDIQSEGYINSGTNAFSGALQLQSNGNGFSCDSQMMSADRNELVLSGNLNNVAVTRRIKVDAKAAAVRYVEVLTNNNAEDVQFPLLLTSSMRAQGLYVTDTGTQNPKALGPKDSGLIVVSRYQNNSYPSAVFWCSGAKSKLKPAIRIQGNQLQVTYNLTIPKGKTVSVTHGVAQRRLNTGGPRGQLVPPDAKTLSDLMIPFQARTWLADLPADIRKSIVNYSGSAAADEIQTGPLLQGVLDLAEQAGIERGKQDVLVFDGEARLTGSVKCPGLTVATRYGNAEVPFDEVALLYGGSGVGRTMRVYLRNGEVLAGNVEAKQMKLSSETGLEVDLAPEQINLLFTHTAAGDGNPSPSATALLTTHFGDRLALAAEQPQKLSAVTPWGPLKVDLAQVAHLSYVQEPQPGHRLILGDRSQLPAILSGGELTLASLRMGSIKLLPHTIRKIVRVQAAKPPTPDSEAPENETPADETDSDWKTPHCQLIGDSVLAGGLDLPQLQVTTTTGNVLLDPKQIHLIERPDADNAPQSFTFELMDGNTLSGNLEQRMLSFRLGDRVWRVPVQHLVSIHVPKPRD